MTYLRLLAVLLPALLSSVVNGDCGYGISGILNGDVCCASGCGSCGGSSCSDLPGGTESCCDAAIANADVSCSKAGEGPCMVVELSGSSSRTPVRTIPTSCGLSTPEFRWNEDSGVAGRMYAEGAGCFTMTDLYNFQGEWNDGKSRGPIYVMDEWDRVDLYPDSFTGKWLLASELYVAGGGTFYCQGTDISGGDCDVLRIESRGAGAYHEIRGYGGNLYFENTLVTSWDTTNREPQEKYTSGRSFINCISEVVTGTTCATENMGECRMDIINSEMGYLGFDDSESYGLTWKVRGFCPNLSNPQVFDDVDVFGDIKDSDIHHMYYGMYSYGHQGGVWTNNKMHDNIVYGFDPHDDSDYLTIAGNEVYNNANHGIIASKRCNNLEIYDNYVHDGGTEAVGIFLHRSGNDCEIYNNVIEDMQDAGIALHESFGADIHDNSVNRAEYGIRLSVGAGNNHVYDNEFNNISGVGIFTYVGTDAPEYGDGRPFNTRFYDNQIKNTAVGVKLKESDRISIKNNAFSGTQEVEFNDAYDTTWEGNTLSSAACLVNQFSTSSFTGSPDLPVAC